MTSGRAGANLAAIASALGVSAATVSTTEVGGVDGGGVHLDDHLVASEGTDRDGTNNKVAGGFDHNSSALFDGHGC